jgi:hypothetical protein
MGASVLEQPVGSKQRLKKINLNTAESSDWQSGKEVSWRQAAGRHTMDVPWKSSQQHNIHLQRSGRPHRGAGRRLTLSSTDSHAGLPGNAHLASWMGFFLSLFE